MTEYSGRCKLCRKRAFWVPCPTGGWWAHDKHPHDNHDAEVNWRPTEHMDDNGDWITI